MSRYYYTNKLLVILALGNLWMLIPTAWGAWWTFSFIHAVQGNTTSMLTSFLLTTCQWLLALGISTWAFFKRWRIAVIAYVIYLSNLIPVYFSTLIRDWQTNSVWDSPSSTLYGYTYLLIWLIGLVTIAVMLIETHYSDTVNMIHRTFPVVVVPRLVRGIQRNLQDF